MKSKIIMLISLLVLLGMWWWSTQDQRVKIIFCDVGQGDGILIKKYNEEILVDVGPNNKKILTCLEKHLPFWDKTIEMLILSHGDSDHVGGLADVLKSYRVETVFSNEPLKPLIEQNIYPKKLSQGDLVKMGMFQFEVVNPEKNDQILNDENDNSIAGVLSYKDFKVFLSGDISQETEQRLVWQKVLRQAQDEVNILKVSHHGSEAATSEEILEILKPKMVVISVGKNNRFGHPREEVLERLKKRGIEIRRTDKEGEVVMEIL